MNQIARILMSTDCCAGADAAAEVAAQVAAQMVRASTIPMLTVRAPG